MHFIGMAGMPRRIPDYADGYLNWNLIMTLGTFLTIISVLILLYNVIQLLSTRISSSVKTCYTCSVRYYRGLGLLMPVFT